MKKCILTLAVIIVNKSIAQIIPPPMAENIEYKPGYQDPTMKGTEIRPFRQGFARIVKDGKEFYIDVNGQKAFDYMVSDEKVKLGDKYDILDYQKELKETGEMPQTVILFVKEGKKGVLSPDGKIILPAKYDQIDLKNLNYWKLSLNGKESMYLPGYFGLPFFDEINYLDGRYFDVKQGSKWGVYDAKKEIMVINPIYEAFDYCGGCARTSDYVYAQKDGKWGIVGFNGEVLVPFNYDHQHNQMRSDNWVQAFSKKNTPHIINIKTRQEFAVQKNSTIAKGLLIYMENGKFGAYDQQGKLVVPFIYDRIDIEGAGAYQNSPGNYLIAGKGEFQGVIDLNGEIVVPIKYDQVTVINNYFVLKKGTKTILADTKLKELISVEDGQITYIDGSTEGGIEPLPIFRIVKKAFFGLYFAKTGKYYEPQFYDIDVDHKAESKIYDLIIAERQGIKTVFDLEGNVLVPGKYNNYTFLLPLGNKRVQVQKDGKIGIYDLDTQQELIPTIYRDYFDFIGQDQETVVCRSGEYESARIELRLIKDGKPLTKQDYSEIATIDSTTFLLSDWKSNRYGLYNAVKKTITNLPYNFVAYIGSDQVLAVSDKDGKAKLYNFHTSKELSKEYQFSFRNEFNSYSTDHPAIINLFKNGIAMIGQNNKLGYIDESGKMIIPMTFDKAKSFDSLGVAVVARDITDNFGTYSKIGFINRKGSFVIPLSDSYQDSFYDNFFVAGKILLTKYNPENRELKFGLADNNGKVFLEPIYDQISPAKDNQYLIIKKGRKYGITDADAKWVVPLSFDDVGLRVYDFYGYTSPVQLFPMPVKEGDQWKFLTEKGTVLPITGDRLSY